MVAPVRVFVCYCRLGVEVENIYFCILKHLQTYQMYDLILILDINLLAHITPDCFVVF